jgi:hypothetical protein
MPRIATNFCAAVKYREGADTVEKSIFSNGQNFLEALVRFSENYGGTP